MALNKIRRRHVDYTWPGFVDALSSLLMVIIFVLMIFVLSQFFLSQKMNGQDEALVKLKTNLIELSELLSIERNVTIELTSNLTIFENKINIIQNKLEQEKIKNDNNKEKLQENEKTIRLSKIKISELEEILNKKIEEVLTSKNTIISLENNLQKRKSEVEIKTDILKANKEEINKLTAASIQLRNKLSQIQTLLTAYKAKDKKDNVKTLNIGKDLNSALARRVEELQKFKSEFFGRVKELIKDRPEIRIVGDRFVFQSEVLFSIGSVEIGPKGQLEMVTLASTLVEIEKSLPTDIDWILQIEGHTDNLPVKEGQTYKDNWELSTKRALSVLRFLIKQGINPSRLSASGYGSFQPIDINNNANARKKNRRIEMTITQNIKFK
ncbi:MAG: peptidoglycan -binding protein [Proteobacteria bacterium]|nr:peptidoglycan -binding protein [Pseudomonadota bacterium]MDA1136110.1 peptidoglycan -binding protein [Pseudomonadota bacterium]